MINVLPFNFHDLRKKPGLYNIKKNECQKF